MAETLELEDMKRPQLAEVAEHYGVKLTPGMSNVQAVAAIRAAAGYAPQESQGQQPEGSQTEGGQSGAEKDAPAIEYVMMRRITDGDGPHPIHPDEVQNYIAGDWVVVEGEE